MIYYLHDIYEINAATKNRKRAEMFDRFYYYTEDWNGSIFFIDIFLLFSDLHVLDRRVTPRNHTDVFTWHQWEHNWRIHYFVMLSYFLLVLSFIGISCSDLLFTKLIANSPIMANLIEMKVEELNVCLEEKLDDSMIKFKLRNILLMHREMTELSLQWSRCQVKHLSNGFESFTHVQWPISSKFLKRYALRICRVDK